jgi:enoyl-CoA hydratase/carnithine racemase
MPGALRDAVRRAAEADRVHIIVLAGTGQAFCAGYDNVMPLGDL